MSFFARIVAKAWGGAPSGPLDAGIAAIERRRFDLALAHLADALAAASAPSERAAIHNKRGIALLGRGDRAAAIDAFVDALSVDERFVPVIVNIGNLLLEDGNVDDAIAHYEAALRIDDAYANAHLNLGVAYKRLGRRSEAVREFRRAGKIEGSLRRANRR